ncbi:MAG TPA: phosphatase PAP2 family protein [Bacteroidota bacterium]|nr:phosphatase PAP2 family protein [Bacteroidota bacterium]
MSDFLYSVDKAVFFFINHTLANPLFDWLMPFLTDLNKHWETIVIVALLWAWMMIRGGKNGRTAGILLVLAIAASDQLSSAVIKHLVGRIRPCHVLQGVRLLVDCGSGLSFPSSHAVNNFAGATILSHYYRKYRWGWFSIASVIAFSRPYIGVHYPSDILGGAIIGWAVAQGIIIGWEFIETRVIYRGKEAKS